MDSLKRTLERILQYLFKCERRTLLWTNPNPNEPFAAQTLTLPDFGSYDYLEIDVRGGSGAAGSCYTNKYAIEEFKAGGDVWLFNPAQGVTDFPSFNGRKIIYRSNTQIYFSSGTYWNTGGYATNSNNNGRPIRIYGIKVGGGTA